MAAVYRRHDSSGEYYSSTTSSSEASEALGKKSSLFWSVITSVLLIFAISGISTFYAIQNMGLHERVAPPENGGDAPALKEALETENFTLAPSRPTAGSGQRSSRTHSSVSQKITTWESVPTRDEGRLPEVPGGPTQLPVETTEASTRGPLLLCTVGPSLQEQSIPPDGICDQLFYTSVHVMRRTVHSVHDELGWLRFKEAMAAVSQPGTTGGLAFDVRYLEEKALYDSELRTDLRTLSTKNIRHFGILNVIANADVLTGMVAKLKKITARLKMLQYHDKTRFLAVAMGLSTYNQGSAWDKYRQLLRTVSSFPVDVLVAISSVSTIGDNECSAIPPSVWQSANGTSPTIKHQLEFVSESAQYVRSDIRLGLSFEMGVTSYVLQDPSTRRNSSPFAPCGQYSLDSYEQVCRSTGKVSRITSIETNVGSSGSWIFFFDDEYSLVEKAQKVMTSARKNKFCWLLFDVHLTDLSGTCSPLFHREKKFAQYLRSLADEKQHGYE